MSHLQISREIPCARSAVYYHLTEGARKRASEKEREKNNRHIAEIKKLAGGACAVCGYSKCLDALDFDHIHPETKRATVSELRGKFNEALEEAGKCLLLCANCHRERHAGVLDIGGLLPPPEDLHIHYGQAED
jgi:5-methylcytosine-specific restriction endonuclease McrA